MLVLLYSNYKPIAHFLAVFSTASVDNGGHDFLTDDNPIYEAPADLNNKFTTINSN
jgi:hypothetical protein